MIKALKSFLNISLILFFILIFSAEARAEVGTPKIIKLTAQDTILLSGLAPANSEILIYLDGSFIGQAEAKPLNKIELPIVCPAPDIISADCQADWNFSFFPNPKLASGTHIIMAVAKDKTSLVLSAPTHEIKFAINDLPAPTLIAPNEKTATGDLRPQIIGLTKDNTLVKIFIDEVFSGQTGVNKNESGTANFIFRSAFDLSRGFHRVQARAENNNGQTSPISGELIFKIELPMPAPTIFKPVVNQATSSNRPFIVGLAKNGSQIKIFIDKKYHGQLTVKDHLSGTANFAIKPAQDLARGEHTVYAVAVDKRGKQSSWSNTVSFKVKNSIIAESVQEERQQAVAEIQAPAETGEISPAPAVISPSTGAVVDNTGIETQEPAPVFGRATSSASDLSKAIEENRQADVIEENNVGTAVEDAGLDERQLAIKQGLADREKAALEKVKSLIGADTQSLKNDRGLVNEGKQNQATLKLSIMLFILFLVGVVAWLLWVNRELVKERRAQNEQDNKEAPPNADQLNK